MPSPMFRLRQTLQGDVPSMLLRRVNVLARMRVQLFAPQCLSCSDFIPFLEELMDIENYSPNQPRKARTSSSAAAV